MCELFSWNYLIREHFFQELFCVHLLILNYETISFPSFSAGLQASFNKFGSFKIEWPGRDGMSTSLSYTFEFSGSDTRVFSSPENEPFT